MKIKDIYYYIQGNTRLYCYNNKYLSWLIPKHIKEQFVYRVNSMDVDCLNTGSCKKCGCKTLNLQFASKPCGGNCYPKMESKLNWGKSKKFGINANTNYNFKVLNTEKRFLKV